MAMVAAFALAAAAPAPAVAQVATSGVEARLPGSPLFQMIDSSKGLPSNRVIALAQDRDGLLWIGTRDGLASFDGVQFRIYRHDPRDVDSLPGNSVQALHVDAENRLWVATEGGGLSVLDARRKTWRHLRAETDPRFKVEDVWAIASTDDGALWFGGFASGLYRYDLERDVLEHFAADASNPRRNHVVALQPLKDGRVLAGTADGLEQAGPQGLELLPFDAGELRGVRILNLAADASGQVRIGASTGLFELSDGVLRKLELPPGPLSSGVTSLLRSRDGSYWLGTRTGMGVDEGQGWRTVQGQGIPAQARMVLAILEDFEGDLWFATYQGGLAYLPPDWRDFSVLESGVNGALKGSATDLAQTPDGVLWIVGGESWLVRADASGMTRINVADSAVSVRLNSLAALPDGSLLLGYNSGVMRYEPARKTFTPWPPAADEALIDDSVNLLRRVGDDVWIYFYGDGLERRSIDGRLIKRFLVKAAEDSPATKVEAVVQDPEGTIWLAATAGVLRLDESGSLFVPVAGVATGPAYGIDFAPDGTLWVQGAKDVTRYRRDGENWQLMQRYAAPDGPPATEGGGLIVADNGDVFVTSLRGLYRYRESSGWRRYGLRDGLPSEEFGLLPPLRLLDGSIAATTLGGVVTFDPARLSEPPPVPALRIAGIDMRRDGILRELDPAGPIKIAHGDRELRIVARLASLADPAANRYRFRLDGYEDDWVEEGFDGVRVFSQLPSGQYELAVQGMNAAGAWSEPVRIRIDVTPPWWRTGPAMLGYALLAVLLLALGATLQRRRLARAHRLDLAERQRQWAEAASDAKSQFLATMGHEIRTPMTGVLGMAELMAREGLPPRQQQRAEAILQSGKLMLRLLDDALELARIEAGKLQFAHECFELPSLLAQVHSLLAPLARKKGLGFGVDADASLPKALFGDPHRLAQILLNLGNNAIKFTAEGKVSIRVARRENGIEFAVCDTGPGMDVATCSRVLNRFEQADGEATARRYGGAGLGLAICDELARAMGGKIEVESTLGVGSTFRAWLPLETADEGCAPPADNASTHPHRACKVLLVEDDATSAEVLQGLLQAQGHHVVHAPQALAALSELSAQRFDLALVDLDLPGMGGLELARIATGLPDAPPLVAITATADPRVQECAHEAGMVGFARKPLDGEALAEVVARWARSNDAGV